MQVVINQYLNLISQQVIYSASAFLKKVTMHSKKKMQRASTNISARQNTQSLESFSVLPRSPPAEERSNTIPLYRKVSMTDVVTQSQVKDIHKLIISIRDTPSREQLGIAPTSPLASISFYFEAGFHTDIPLSVYFKAGRYFFKASIRGVVYL